MWKIIELQVAAFCDFYYAQVQPRAAFPPLSNILVSRQWVRTIPTTWSILADDRLSHYTHPLRGKRMGYSRGYTWPPLPGSTTSLVRPHAVLFGDVPVGDAYDVPLFPPEVPTLPSGNVFPRVAMATRLPSVTSKRTSYFSIRILMLARYIMMNRKI